MSLSVGVNYNQIKMGLSDGQDTVQEKNYFKQLKTKAIQGKLTEQDINNLADAYVRGKKGNDLIVINTVKVIMMISARSNKGNQNIFDSAVAKLESQSNSNSSTTTSPKGAVADKSGTSGSISTAKVDGKAEHVGSSSRRDANIKADPKTIITDKTTSENITRDQVSKIIFEGRRFSKLKAYEQDVVNMIFKHVKKLNIKTNNIKILLVKMKVAIQTARLYGPKKEEEVLRLFARFTFNSKSPEKIQNAIVAFDNWLDKTGKALKNKEDIREVQREIAKEKEYLAIKGEKTSDRLMQLENKEKDLLKKKEKLKQEVINATHKMRKAFHEAGASRRTMRSIRDVVKKELAKLGLWNKALHNIFEETINNVIAADKKEDLQNLQADYLTGYSSLNLSNKIKAVVNEFVAGTLTSEDRQAHNKLLHEATSFEKEIEKTQESYKEFSAAVEKVKASLTEQIKALEVQKDKNLRETVNMIKDTLRKIKVLSKEVNERSEAKQLAATAEKIVKNLRERETSRLRAIAQARIDQYKNDPNSIRGALGKMMRDLLDKYNQDPNKLTYKAIADLRKVMKRDYTRQEIDNLLDPTQNINKSAYLLQLSELKENVEVIRNLVANLEHKKYIEVLTKLAGNNSWMEKKIAELSGESEKDRSKKHITEMVNRGFTTSDIDKYNARLSDERVEDIKEKVTRLLEKYQNSAGPIAAADKQMIKDLLHYLPPELKTLLKIEDALKQDTIGSVLQLNQLLKNPANRKIVIDALLKKINEMSLDQLKKLANSIDDPALKTAIENRLKDSEEKGGVSAVQTANKSGGNTGGVF